MTWRHGTQYAYRKKGCRCEECRGWFNAVMRAYRQRRMRRDGMRMLHGKFVPGESQR